MAESLADLFVRLSADTSDFKPALDDAAATVDALGNKIEETGKKIPDAFDPGDVAQPPFSTKSPCDHESTFLSAARLADTSGAR